MVLNMVSIYFFILFFYFYSLYHTTIVGFLFIPHHCGRGNTLINHLWLDAGERFQKQHTDVPGLDWDF